MSELREWDLKVLETLRKLDGRGSMEDVAEASGLAHATVARSAFTLKERGLIKIHEEPRAVARLSPEGASYAEKGLPERRLLNAIQRLHGEASMEEAAEAAGLSGEALSIAIGWARRKGWVSISEGRVTMREAPPQGSDERLLELLKNKGRVELGELDEELRSVIPTLRRRGLVEVEERVLRELEITEDGLKLLEVGVPVVEEVSQLTPELIVSGRWRQVRFRRFDVKAPGPTIHPGRPHPVQQIIQWVREIFLEMGFTEIRGPIVELAFWNFDALFQPQDHPAREMQDTFYLEEPELGDLPEERLVDAVARTHEDGWETGSRGWRYKWSREEARRLVLRTHTTAVTIRYLAEHNEPPVWVFSVDRVYRNEKVDYKHLAEFHQIEGIIMDEGVTLRDLMGILTEFYRKLGLEKVQFWPSYFPYTEPSMQSTVYIPELGAWVELCGMGIFRPEVVAPMGVKHPVLAWGGGLERLIMLKLGVDDIRLLYKNDLSWIRRTPICP